MLSQEIMYPTEKKRKGITDSETKQCNAKEREAVMMSKLDDEGMWRNFSQTTGFHGLNKITFETKHTRQIIRRYRILILRVQTKCFIHGHFYRLNRVFVSESEMNLATTVLTFYIIFCRYICKIPFTVKCIRQ